MADTVSFSCISYLDVHLTPSTDTLHSAQKNKETIAANFLKTWTFSSIRPVESNTGRPGELVVALECYWSWSVSSNPAVARF